MTHKLHNHPITEMRLELDKENLVIIDKEFVHMFSGYTEIDDKHVIVSKDEFSKIMDINADDNINFAEALAISGINFNY